MNTTIIASRASSVPVVDLGSSLILAAARNRMIREYPAQPEFLLEPLLPADRTSLERRKALLEHWLRPAPKDDYPRLTKTIAEMLGSFGAGSNGSEKAIVAKWLHVVSDLPTWAIMQACAQIEGGEAEGVSLDYRPSAPRLKAVAKSALAPWLEELANIKLVLTAEALEPQDALMRERIGELLRDLAAQLRGNKRRSEDAEEGRRGRRGRTEAPEDNP